MDAVIWYDEVMCCVVLVAHIQATTLGLRGPNTLVME